MLVVNGLSSMEWTSTSMRSLHLPLAVASVDRQGSSFGLGGLTKRLSEQDETSEDFLLLLTV